MDDKISGAIEVLTAKLEEYLKQASETKKMINSLRQMVGETPLFNDVSVEHVSAGAIRQDQYYGKPLSTVATQYLEYRKQACLADEILKGLEQGGFDFDALGWKEKDRMRALSMSLAKNSKTFHRLPNGSFGLLAWYDKKSIRQRGEKDESETDATAAVEPAKESKP
jgi:hypothetical protein